MFKMKSISAYGIKFMSVDDDTVIVVPVSACLAGNCFYPDCEEEKEHLIDCGGVIE